MRLLREALIKLARADREILTWLKVLKMRGYWMYFLF